MSTAAIDPYETDEERQERQEREAAAAQNRQGFERRQAERDAKVKEAEDTKAENERLKRENAMLKVRPTLNATGPLDTYLKHYTGEPTADAIRQAVAADDDFKALITFAPDPRDEAAGIQAEVATKLRGGDHLAKVQTDTAPGTDRLRHAYDNPDARTA